MRDRRVLKPVQRPEPGTIRPPEYSWWPFGELDPRQQQARHAQELALRSTPRKIPTVFGDL